MSLTARLLGMAAAMFTYRYWTQDQAQIVPPFPAIHRHWRTHYPRFGWDVVPSEEMAGHGVRDPGVLHMLMPYAPSLMHLRAMRVRDDIPLAEMDQLVREGRVQCVCRISRLAHHRNTWGWATLVCLSPTVLILLCSPRGTEAGSLQIRTFAVDKNLGRSEVRYSSFSLQVSFFWLMVATYTLVLPVRWGSHLPIDANDGGTITSELVNLSDTTKAMCLSTCHIQSRRYWGWSTYCTSTLSGAFWAARSATNWLEHKIAVNLKFFEGGPGRVRLENLWTLRITSA